MKLEIKRDRSEREPVAYIDNDGDLIIRRHDHDHACGLDLGSPGYVYRDLLWEPGRVEPENLIFPGDSIVLTF